MSSQGLIKSSIGRKLWMALTGLFLVLFLVVHLAGNLQLIYGTQEGFNEYSQFMTTFPLIKITSYLLYASILLHAVDGFMLARSNRAARPVRYAMNKPGENSSWASRSMALLGTITLVFLIIHMKSFWYEMHFGNIPMDANGMKDLYSITIAAFENPLYSLLYVICMIALGFHLSHGIQSAFQTLGLNHPGYTPGIKKFGSIFAWLMSGLFALIPIWIYLT
jgi:succinate dehydrogenase / fumarate reductase, cytochrome b subunit